MDNWQNGTGFRALETELPDRSNVMTILGAATGRGNAITDLSFSANSLIPAKNSSFIMNNYDENITGQKTFNTTIHSVGILVQNYENNSVVCAAGGDKAIQDINASIDLSNYYNKSQTYSQTETDQKFNQKLNISDQIDACTKTQDDALLLLKADETQLIDSHTKGETNNVLNNKADSGVSYIKGEDDIQLSLKADKTQLIDSYTKGEADNLSYGEISEDEEDYTTHKEEQITYISISGNQQIIGTKSFYDNIAANGFIKSGCTNEQVLLVNQTKKPLSEIPSGGETVKIITGKVAINETKFEGFAPSMNIKIRTLPQLYAPTVRELCMPVGGPYSGFKPHIRNTGEIRCYIVRSSWIEQKSFSGILLDAAGLSDFLELYAYIKERYSKLIDELPQPVSIGKQTLQEQVKNNDDIIYASNKMFEPPIPNAITKHDLNSQLKRQSFLASSGQEPKLIVYSDRITLIASYATTASNDALYEDVESHIDEVIIIHEKQLTSNSFYIIGDGTCRVCIFNLYFESKGLQWRTQEVGRIPDSTIPVYCKKSIPYDSTDVFKYCASGIQYL
ncbi:MAG: hypothetical protein EZS28_003632 [Streblomastix strix]|uniref:Uncharacterized protein n=1 Tax=Streblomastix strix TaxID=222440 RepID=A0A5J4X0M2_9EUKA|nr:MAG: hypothetical protein EZS28_003632 [Streblomastix strix]